jgi:glycosyltransferase involved in cell wall biosynthesis
VSPRSVLVPAVATPEFPGHALVARQQELARRGWDPHVACDGADRSYWRALLEPSDGEAPLAVHHADLRWHDPRRPRGAKALAERIRRAREARVRVGGRLLERSTGTPWEFGKALLKIRPDLVHWPSGPSALESIAAKRRLGFRAVVTLGGADLRVAGLAAAGYYEPVWRDADVLHLPEAGLWERALARGCPEDKPHAVIPPATDRGFFDPDREADARTDGSASRPLRLLTVAPLEWTQGHEHALHALRLLLDRGVDAEYRIVGNGEYVGAVGFARYQLGLEDQATLLDPLPPEELRAQFAWADAFVSAAVVEGTPGALVDAQAMGLPAVVSDAGRGRDALDGTSLVARRRDPMALADALAEIEQDQDLRRRLGERARERARRLTLDEQVEAFERLYYLALSS